MIILILLTIDFFSFVITIDQMRAGFHRLYEDMEEYSLDVPNAYTVLGRWVIRCRQVDEIRYYLVYDSNSFFVEFKGIKNPLTGKIILTICGG